MSARVKRPKPLVKPAPVLLSASQTALFQLASQRREQAIAQANAAFKQAILPIRTELGFAADANVVVDRSTEAPELFTMRLA